MALQFCREVKLLAYREVELNELSLEGELFQKRRFKTRAEAKMAVFDYIEAWYKRNGGPRSSEAYRRLTTETKH